jgi:hypothetical protein
MSDFRDDALNERVTKAQESKLQDAYLMGCNDIQACSHAGILLSKLEQYQRDNPKLLEQRAVLQASTLVMAKDVIRKSLEQGNVQTALRLYEIERRVMARTYPPSTINPFKGI